MEETQAPMDTTAQLYVPSSTQKKRAVMMYMLIGIIVVALNNQKKSDFELFHLKQALGWRSVFLLVMIATAVMALIPLIRYIPILVVLVMVVFLGLFIKNARDGKYAIAQDKKLAIFSGLGERIMTLFEVKTSEPTQGKMNNE